MSVGRWCGRRLICMTASLVAMDTAAAAADVELRSGGAGAGTKNQRVAHFETALIVASIGIVRSLVLAIGVRIELCAVAGVVNYLCDFTGVAAATQASAAAPNNASFVIGILRVVAG
jgi:hypothetical protein